MVPPIPSHHRREILHLREAGHSFRNIRDILSSRGAHYSVIGIGNCYQKMVKNGMKLDTQPKQKYSKELLERIKQELQFILEENSDLTGQQQIEELRRRLGVTISMDAVGRYRRLLGWKVMPTGSNTNSNNGGAGSSSSFRRVVEAEADTAPPPVVVDPEEGIAPDCVPPIEFYSSDDHSAAQFHQSEVVISHHLVGEEEEQGWEQQQPIQYQLHQSVDHPFGEMGAPNYIAEERRFGPEHVFTSKSFIKSTIGGVKYQVWAGISYQGATSICIWDAECRVKSSFYCNTILREFFLPFRQERYPEGSRCVLVQNSADSIYRSHETRQFLTENSIESEMWAPQEDLTPIDSIWEEINDHVRTSPLPVGSLADLREVICSFWATQMTDEKCRDVIRNKCPLFSTFE